jgi:hypothetical protein
MRGVCSIATAADADAAASNPLRYRRILAPADSIADWPRGNDRYLPVEPAEFNELIRSAQGHSGPSASAPRATITSTHLHARLVDEHLLEGTATVDIAATLDKNASAVPWSPCNLAIESLKWSTPDGEVAIARTRDGGSMLVVPTSGVATMTWSLVGARDAAGSVQFDLVLPPSARHSLTVDLPEALVLTSSAGLAQESPAENSLRRWRIELGGATRTALRLSSRQSNRTHTPTALVRTNTTYELSQRGIDIAAQWKLDLQQESLRQADITMDPVVRLVSVKVGDVPRAWTVVESDEHQRRVVVELPEHARTTQRTLRLSALAPLSADELFNLPRLMPGGSLAWQEGLLSLIVPSTYVLKHLVPNLCRQSKASQLTAPLLGESLEFQSYAPDASARLLISRQRQRPRLALGTAITVGDAACSARVTADFELLTGDRFNLHARVGAGWVIDSVETSPSHALGDWTVEPSESGPPKLDIRLAKALTPSRPIRLIIAARRWWPDDSRRLGPEESLVVRFDDCTSISDLLSLAAETPKRIKIQGVDNTLLLDSKQLTQTQRELLGDEPTDGILDRSRIETVWRASIVKELPLFTSTAIVEAIIAPESLTERYVIGITPESRPVDRVRVRLTQSRDGVVNWKTDARGAMLTVRRVSSAAAAKADPAFTGEVWELRFGSPQAEAFEISGQRVTADPVDTPVSLAAFERATRQEGRVLVRREGLSNVILDNRGLSETWPDANGTSDATDDEILASFHYEPLREVARPANEGLRLAFPKQSMPQPGAVVQLATIDSRYEASGRSTHRARFGIHNRGLDRLTLVAPDGASLVDCSLDGQRVKLDGTQVELPSNREFCEIVVDLLSQDAPLSTLSRRTPMSLGVSIPVIEQRRTCSLPPGFELLRQTTQPATSVGKRLFGFLARDASDQPFDPLSSDAWASLFEPGHSPSNATQDADSRGWATYVITPSTNASESIAIVASNSLRAWSWATTLLSVAVMLWLGSRRIGICLVICGGALLIALAVPAWITSLTSAVFIGTLAGCAAVAVGRVWPITEAAGSTTDPPSIRIKESVRLGVTLLALTALNVDRAAAQDQPPSEAVRPEYRVFIPCDDQGKPTGGRYSVPEAFYNALVDRASSTGATSPAWSLRAANYRLALSDNVAARGLEVTELIATFDVVVERTGAKILLPLRRDAVSTADNAVKVDGQVVDVVWDDASTMSIEAPMSGLLQLEVSLRPSVQVFADGTGFDLAVPTLSNSRLHAIVPGEHDVTVVSALGATRWSADRTSLDTSLGDASLGNSGRLAVRWRDGPRAAAASAEVDELLWLKVRPGSVVLDARLNVRITPGASLRELQLAIDPRLRVLPSNNPSMKISEQSSVGDASDMRKIQVSFAQPVTDSISIPVSMLLSEASGLGRFHLPKFAVSGVSIARRSLAVTVDPTLTYQTHEDASVTSMNVAQFVALWPGSAATPQLAYELSGVETSWRLDTRPTLPQTTGRQSMVLNAGATRLDIRYETQLSTGSGYVFQHRLRVPQGVEVESVSLLEDGAERAQHWAYDDQGTFTVFLSDAVTGSQSLSVKASMPLSADAPTTLPLLSSKDIPIAGMTVTLLRQNNISASLEKVVDLVDAQASSSANDTPVEHGRLVGTWTVSSERASATLKVSDDPLRVDAEQVVTLAREEQSWTAEAALSWRMTSGVLDVLRLEIPSTWRGPFRITPAATSEVIELPGQNRSILVVYPASPLRDELRLTISGPLNVAAGQSVVAPAIVPLDVAKSKRLVRLPVQLGLQHAMWETVSMRRVEPSDRVTVDPASAVYEWYEELGLQPAATLRSLQRVAAIPRCHLADVSVTCGEDDVCRGTVTFDVELADAVSCKLAIPHDVKLLQVVVNSRLMTISRADSGHVTVPVIRTTLPQRIEVSFAAPMQRNWPWQSPTIDAPALADLPAERTLWTIRLAAGYSKPTMNAAKPVVAVAQDLVRLQAIADIANRPSDETSALSVEEIARWAETWQRSWLEIRQRIARESLTAHTASQVPNLTSKLAALDRTWTTLCDRLGISFDERSLATPDVATPAWMTTLTAPATSRPTARLAVQGALPHVTVTTQRLALEDIARRGLAITIFGLAMLVASRRRWWSEAVWLDALRRWPHLWIAMIGMSWWLWLQPSIVGLFIVASCAASSAASMLRATKHAAEPTVRIVKS